MIVTSYLSLDGYSKGRPPSWPDQLSAPFLSSNHLCSIRQSAASFIHQPIINGIGVVHPETLLHQPSAQRQHDRLLNSVNKLVLYHPENFSCPLRVGRYIGRLALSPCFEFDLAKPLTLLYSVLNGHHSVLVDLATKACELNDLGEPQAPDSRHALTTYGPQRACLVLFQ